MKSPRPLTLQGKPVSDGAFPLICSPLIARNCDDLRQEASVIAAKKPDMIEWRIDYFDDIGNTALIIEMAHELKAIAKEIPILLTRRSAFEGGQAITLSEAAVLELHLDICRERCVDAVDYELRSSVQDLERVRSASANSGIALVMSFHNFALTPGADKIRKKFETAQSLGADVGKVAVMPQNPADVLRLLTATHEASQALDIALVSMSMGPVGAISRLTGWLYGSAMTFAAGMNRSESGQPSIEDLRTVLAAMRQALPRAQ